MIPPRPHRALPHAIAVPIALLVSWGLLSGSHSFRENQLPVRVQDTLDYPLHGYFPTLEGHPFFTDALAKTLTDGSSIVLMGSSELSTADHPSKPVLFFKDSLDVPLIAIGHADNQSFSMYAQLLAAGSDLANARLAILISPSWFVGNAGKRGTNLASFMEYQPSPSLYRIQERVDRRDTLAMPVAAYLNEHMDQLTSTEPVVQWLAHDGSWRTRALFFFGQPWDAEIIRRTTAEMRAGQPLRHWLPDPRMDPGPERWEQLYAKGVTEHLARSTNNTVYVNDAYYSEYVNGQTHELQVLPVAENREMNDLVRLLDYVQHMHGRPFFIIQPLNPFVYTNLKEVSPTIAWIRNELDQRNLPYLDLWEDDTARFRPGTLTDVMHLGPLGWYRVDSAMNAYFQ